MKKRVLSFLLCLLMVLPLVLTSCSGGEGETTTTGEETLYVKPCTLNFYIVTEQMSNEARAAQQLMQEAFNKYAMEEYKTQVQFIFCTAEDYLSLVLDDLENAAAITEQEGTYASQKFEKAEVETAVDHRGDTYEKYPEIYNNQIDLLLINGKDVYNKLRTHLADLDETLALYPEILQRVNANLVNGARDAGKLYGVPNNVMIGNYKYVLVNKDIAFRYQYAKTADRFMVTRDGKQLLDYSALRLLAQQVQTSKNGADADYLALKNSLSAGEIYPMDRTFDFPTVTYLPYGSEDTLFGVVYEYDSTYLNHVAVTNVLSNEFFKGHLSLMIEAKQYEYFPDAVNEKTDAYAIRYVEGSYVDREKYEDDYFVYEIDRPRLEDDGAFDAMFAVSKYTASLSRSVEIIEALIADEDAVLRNILQYGVEGTHFNVYTDEDTGLEYVERTTAGKHYMMNVNYTGNVITAFPCEEDGRDLGYAEYVKNQNESAKRNPLYSLTTTRLWGDVESSMAEKYALLNMMRDKIEAEINALPTTSPVLKNKNKTALIAELNKIHKKYDLNLLNEFWWKMEQELDPCDELPTGIEIKDEVKDRIRTKRLALYATALKDSKAFIKQSVEISNHYMKAALACTTVSELEQVCKDLENLRNASTKTETDPIKNGKYFWSQGNATWEEGGFYGMLYAPAADTAAGSASLAGALNVWWNGLQ